LYFTCFTQVPIAPLISIFRRLLELSVGASAGLSNIVRSTRAKTPTRLRGGSTSSPIQTILLAMMPMVCAYITHNGKASNRLHQRAIRRCSYRRCPTSPCEFHKLAVHVIYSDSFVPPKRPSPQLGVSGGPSTGSSKLTFGICPIIMRSRCLPDGWNRAFLT